MSKSDKSNEKRLRLIHQCMAFGLSTEESLEHLKKNGINICERTLRRDKKELKKQYGLKVENIFEKETASDIFKDFFTFQEIHNECWKMIRNENTPVKEKIRLFDCLMKTINEKLALHKKLSYNVRGGYITEIGDDALPFEVTIRKPSNPILDPGFLELIRKMPDITKEENDRKTDKSTQVDIPEDIFANIHS